MGYVYMSDLPGTTSVQPVTTSAATGVKEIDAIGVLISDAMKISGPLASSGAQVDDKRRAFADLMSLAAAAAGRMRDHLVDKLGWPQEGAAFGRVKDAGARAVTLAGEHKSADASWSALDAAARESESLLQAAKNATLSRARSEAQGAVSSTEAAIGALSAKSPMTEADWTAVDGLVARIQGVKTKFAALPLEAKDLAALSGVTARLTSALEAKVAALSSPFSNKVEELLVTQAKALQPQQGRKLANWVDKHKVWIGLGVVSLVVAKAASGGESQHTIVTIER